VLGLTLEYAGAPLRLEKKVAFLQRKRDERRAKGKKVGVGTSTGAHPHCCAAGAAVSRVNPTSPSSQRPLSHSSHSL
jgi:hypothetical protein